MSLTAAASPVATPRGICRFPIRRSLSRSHITSSMTKRFTCPNPMVINTGLRSRAGRLRASASRRARDLAERRFHQPYGKNEDPDEYSQVAHCPDRLHRSDGAECPLPGSEEQCGKRRVGDSPARVRLGTQWHKEPIPRRCSSAGFRRPSIARSYAKMIARTSSLSEMSSCCQFRRSSTLMPRISCHFTTSAASIWSWPIRLSSGTRFSRSSMVRAPSSIRWSCAALRWLGVFPACKAQRPTPR